MLAWLQNLLVRTKPTDSVGTRGERLASNWLRARGYKILERNLPLGDDEADLVALDPDQKTVVIVEVKTREVDASHDDANAATPELAVTRTKQFHISRLAARLQQSKKYKDRPFRFDVVAVVITSGESADSGGSTIRHIPGAFEAPF